MATPGIVFVLFVKTLLLKREGNPKVRTEGKCAAWLHRGCAGLTKMAFKEVCSAPDTPFYCPHCHIALLVKEITSLKKSMETQQ